MHRCGAVRNPLFEILSWCVGCGICVWFDDIHFWPLLAHPVHVAGYATRVTYFSVTYAYDPYALLGAKPA